MKAKLRLVSTYVLIAGFAALINIGSQMAVVALYKGPYYIHISIAAGLIVALPVKYVLEKYYVFSFESRDLGHDTRLFAAYTALGASTTLVFLATEYAFHYLFDTDAMRYLGAALGLALGHYLKYHLDKRFVFIDRQHSA